MPKSIIFHNFQLKKPSKYCCSINVKIKFTGNTAYQKSNCFVNSTAKNKPYINCHIAIRIKTKMPIEKPKIGISYNSKRNMPENYSCYINYKLSRDI